MKTKLKNKIIKMNTMLQSNVEPYHRDLYTIGFSDPQTGIMIAWDNDNYYTYKSADKARHNYVNYMQDNDLDLRVIVMQYKEPSPAQASLEALIGKIKKGFEED